MQIPIQNIWWMMLYASDLGEAKNKSLLSIEDLPEDIPDLIGEILSKTVENRLRRQLTFSFQEKKEILNRVRGKINHLITYRKKLLSKGQISCQFNELTVDNLRNRYARSALEKISMIIKNKSLSHRCRRLAKDLFIKGVTGPAPTQKEISTQRYGRNDQADKEMITVAKLAMDMCIPNENEGAKELLNPEKLEKWLPNLYEKAIGNFYKFHLDFDNWKVKTSKKLNWSITNPTDGISEIFPTMKTDIVLDNIKESKRIIIDTKFTSIFTKTNFKNKSLKTNYIYQIYAYLMSQQEKDDPLNKNSAGMLLHPAIGENIDESANIQGHDIKFSTVDLTQNHNEIKQRLLELIS